jgi:hypothetical protein
MNQYIDPLGDPLTTRPILMGSEFTMEPLLTLVLMDGEELDDT